MAEWLLRQFGRLVPFGIVGSIPTLSEILPCRFCLSADAPAVFKTKKIFFTHNKDI